MLLLIASGIGQSITKAQEEQSMTEEMFWKLIEQSRSNECEVLAENLTNYLQELETSEIIEFERIFQKLMNDAYRWDLWAISYIVNGGSSDDGFEYFRAWLISRGESFYQASLKNAEAAADGVKPGDVAECEDILYVTSMVYKSLTGDEIPYPPLNTKEPAGQPWEEDDLQDMYPELVEKFS
jgi:hypothetical protein